MTGFLAMVRVTWKQLLGGKRVIAFGLLGLLPATVMWFSSSRLPESAVIDQFHDAPIATLFLIVLPVIALVLGASSLGDERRDGTLSFLLLRPRPRWVIALANLFTAWLATTVLVATSGAVAAAVVAIRIGDTSLIAPVIIAAAISSLAYTAVFMILGYLTARAVLVGLVYVFIWENGITFGAAALANVSLFRIGVSAYVGLVPESYPVLGEVLGSVTPGVGGAIAKVIVLGVLSVAAGGAMLRRSDTL